MDRRCVLHNYGEVIMNTPQRSQDRTGDGLLALAVALAGCLLLISWTFPG